MDTIPATRLDTMIQEERLRRSLQFGISRRASVDSGAIRNNWNRFQILGVLQGDLTRVEFATTTRQDHYIQLCAHIGSVQ